MRFSFGVSLLCLLFLARCDGEEAIDIVPPGGPPALPITMADGFVVESFASGLALPTSLAFAPDGSGRLFVNELQTGRIRVIEEGTLRPEPFAEIETNTQGGFPVDGENGLLGLAFDPDFAANGHVYVTYAARTDAGTRATVARFTERNGRGEDFTILLDDIPAQPGHQIQSLAFGPDGKLYVSVGDAYLADEVQNLDSPLGKILRMNPDGNLPADNPFPGSYTYAYGFRNSFDLAFDAAGTLFSADNGPATLDELNRVERGGNYGWPITLGPNEPPGVPDLVAPLHAWPQIVSPAGMLFYRGTQFPARYRGKLFLVLFGDTFSAGPSPRAKRVQVVDLDGSAPRFEDLLVYDFGGEGNPLDLAEGPDGSLYLTDIFQGRVYRIRYTGS